MRVSLREARMVLERMMQVAGVAEGMVASVRDCALYSAALGLGGFARLNDNIVALRAAGGARPCLLTTGDNFVVDGEGQHAWMVADALLDIAVDAWRSSGIASISVIGIISPEELAVLAALAQKHAVSVDVDIAKGGRTSLSLGPASTAPLVLDRIRHEGLPVDSALWWALFHRSSEALAADTVQSRRHAGPIRVEDDGRIIGRQDDDETDISLLTGDINSKQGV